MPKPLTIEDKKLNIDDSTFLQTLDGFLLVLAKEGDFVYLSENVSDYLGITQVIYLLFWERRFGFFWNDDER